MQSNCSYFDILTFNIFCEESIFYFVTQLAGPADEHICSDGSEILDWLRQDYLNVYDLEKCSCSFHLFEGISKCQLNWNIQSVFKFWIIFNFFIVKKKSSRTAFLQNLLMEYHFGNRYSILPSDTWIHKYLLTSLIYSLYKTEIRIAKHYFNTFPN